MTDFLRPRLNYQFMIERPSMLALLPLPTISSVLQQLLMLLSTAVKCHLDEKHKSKFSHSIVLFLKPNCMWKLQVKWGKLSYQCTNDISGVKG